MNIKGFIKEKRLLTIILTLLIIVVSLIMIIICSSFLKNDYMKVLVIISLSLSTLLSTLNFFLPNKINIYTNSIIPCLLSLSFGEFLHSVIFDFADFFQGIHMFGDASKFPLDVIYLLIIFSTIIISIINVFTNRRANYEQK